AEEKRTLKIQLLQWEEKSQSIQAKKTRLAKQIEEQYELYPFLREADLTYWPELFQKLKHLYQLIQNQHRQQKKLTTLYNTQDELRGELAAFFDMNGFEYEKEDVASQFARLEELLDQHQINESSIKQYREWKQKNKTTQHEVYQQIQTYEKVMKTLYEHANVSTAEEFYKVAANVEEMKDLTATKQQLEHQITTILTPSEFQAMLDGSFHSLDLNKQAEQTELNMKELNDKMEEIRQELANENVKLANMETSEDYSEIAHRFQMEREQ